MRQALNVRTVPPRAHPRILVIRRDNIGDLVCTTPLIAALRAHFPEAYIVALVNSYNAAVLDGNPDLNAVCAYTKLKHREAAHSLAGSLLARLRMLVGLRRRHFDYAILAKSSFDRHGLQLARAVRPRNIVGFGVPEERQPAGITWAVPPECVAGSHEVEAVMRLGEPLGVRSAPGPLRMFPSAQRRREWRMRLPELAGHPDRRWVALHLSAREAARRWQAEKFVELIDRLSEGGGLGFILLWAPGAADNPRHPGDDDKAACVLRRVRPGGCVLSAPTAMLEELTAILSLCDAFIGADGGALHMAAAVGLPIVALFENLDSKKRQWYPWRVPHELVSSSARDVADISVDQVMGAWKKLEAHLAPERRRTRHQLS